MDDTATSTRVEPTANWPPAVVLEEVCQSVHEMGAAKADDTNKLVNNEQTEKIFEIFMIGVP